jgi:phenylalanyl-tRNA synthetase beta subunit
MKVNHENSKEFLVVEAIKDKLVAQGFSEVMTRTLDTNGDLEVAYPAAMDKAFLRKDISTSLEKKLHENVLNAPLLGKDIVKIFEIGKVFTKDKGEALKLAIGIGLTKKQKGLQASDLVSEAFDLLLNETISIRAHPTQAVGEMEIDINSAFDALHPTLSSLSIQKSDKIFVTFSHEPFIVRDIALFVEKGTDASLVQKVIAESLATSAKEFLVKGPDLFDQFEKEDKKSLGFRMIFQAKDRTLSDEEANGFMQKVYETVKEKGWQTR